MALVKRGQQKLSRQPKEDLYEYYCRICALKRSTPLEAVKVGLVSGVVDLNVRRLHHEDWDPLLMAVASSPKSVKTIVIHGGNGKKSEHARLVCEHLDVKMRTKLCDALKCCLKASSHLHRLSLQSIPLQPSDLTLICEGILRNKSLRSLSLQYCQIGDAGFEEVMRGVLGSPVVSLDVSSCCLSSKSAHILVGALKRQAGELQSRVWQGSLRWQNLNLESMPALRHLRVNDNPLLGNKAAEIIAQYLKDDLWVKVLEMNNCGLDRIGAKHFIDALKVNKTLAVLDMQNNPDIPLATQLKLQQAVAGNGRTDLPFEYEEIVLLESQKDSKSQKFSHVRVRPSSCTGCITSANSKTKYKQQVSTNNGKVFKPSRILTSVPKSLKHKTDLSKAKNSNSGQQLVTLQTEVSSLKNDIIQIRKELADEKNVRMAAERKVVSLNTENEFLRTEIGNLTDKLRRAKQGIDEESLTKIHATITQFHNFLDLLQNQA